MCIVLDDLPDSWRSAHVYSFWDDLEIIDETDGNWSVPAGGLYLLLNVKNNEKVC